MMVGIDVQEVLGSVFHAPRGGMSAAIVSTALKCRESRSWLQEDVSANRVCCRDTGRGIDLRNLWIHLKYIRMVFKWLMGVTAPKQRPSAGRRCCESHAPARHLSLV